MPITTKRGDDGSTDLPSGQRVPKDHPLIEALGELDELSSLVGFARLAARLGETAEELEALQRDLVRVAGDIGSVDPAFPDPILPADEEALADKVRALESRIVLRGFVLPGRTEASARLDLARAAARTLERRVVALALHAADREPCARPPSAPLRRYLNRLSDYLFMLARSEEDAEGSIEYARR